MQEETIQELVNTWQETPDGQSFLGELRKKFPNMSSIEEFYISSFIMGSAMGFGGKEGAWAAGIEKYKKSKESQGEGTPALDQTMAEVATDVQVAKEQAIKDVGEEGVSEINESLSTEGEAEQGGFLAEEVVSESPTESTEEVIEEVVDGAPVDSDEEVAETTPVESTIEEVSTVDGETVVEPVEVDTSISDEVTTEESSVEAKDVEVEEDLDTPDVVKELTEEEEKSNELVSAVQSFNSKDTKASDKKSLRDKAIKIASDLGYKIEDKDGKMVLTNEKGKRVSSKSPKLKYKTQPEGDINNVKKAIRTGILTEVSTSQNTEIEGMTGPQISQGIRDINNGKTETVNAKKLVIGFRKALKNGSLRVNDLFNGQKKGRDVSLEGFTDEGFVFEEIPKSDQDLELQRQADAEDSIPESVKTLLDEDLNGEEEVLSDEEFEAQENISDDYAGFETINDISPEMAEEFVAEVQEAFGMTDEEASQMVDYIKTKNKTTDEQDTERETGIQTDKTVAEKTETVEQESEQVDKEKSRKKAKEEPIENSQEEVSRRNKSFLNRVINDPKTPPAHKEMLSNMDEKYTQENNEWQSDQADILIDTFDKDGRLGDLWLEVSDLNTDMSFGVRAMLALKLKRLAESKGDSRQAAEYTNWIDKTARKFGQFNQALIDRNSPESVMRSKTKEWNERADKKLAKSSRSKSGKTVAEDIDSALEDMNKASEAAGKEVAEEIDTDKAVKRAEAEQKIKEDKKKSSDKKKAKSKAKIDKEKSVRKELRKEIKAAKSKYFNSSVGGFTVEGIELAAKVAASYVREGVTRADLLAKKVKSFFSGELNINLTDSQVEQVLNHKREGVNAFDAIIEEKVEQAKVKLSERVLDAASDVSKPKKLEDAVDTVLKELTAKAKQNIEKKKKDENPDKFRDRVFEAAKNRELAKEVWDSAQIKVLDKIDSMVEADEITEAEAAEIRGKLQGFFGDFVGKPFADSIIDKAVSEQLKSMDQKIRDIITKHWTTKGEIGAELASKFVNNAGLDPKTARALEKEVLEAYAKKIKEASEKALDKVLGTPVSKTSKKRKTDTERIIEAFNLGALDSSSFRDLFSEKFGFVSLSNFDKKNIAKFVHDLNLYPEGSEALHRGMSDLNAYLRSLEKDTYKFKFILEFFTEVFYTNVLSGFSTLARGAKGVAMTAAAEILIESVKNPKLVYTTNQGVSALWRGLKRGKKEFLSIMKDGYVPISKNLENTTGSLDRMHNAKWSDLKWGGKFNKTFFYAPVKIVRALIATDALAHYAAKEYFATVAAYNEVLRGGMDKKDSSFWENVEKELHNNKADEKNARSQALVEKQRIIDGGGDLSNFDVERRTREILDGMRSDDIQQFSETKADKSRLGQTPTGVLGYIYEKVNDASANITGLNRIVPFLRIPTNAMDMWLDYTPWGYKRAVAGKSSLALAKASDATKKRLKVGKDNMDPWDRVDHLVKASIGTVSFVAMGMAVMSQMDLEDDDDDKIFDISYKGFGKFRENEGLRETGWREMSFRFKNPFSGEWTEWYDYRDSPMAMLFATLGSVHDEKKYKQAGAEEVDTQDLVSAGVTSSLLFVSEQNYMKSLMNLSDVFSREGSIGSNAENFSGDYITKNVKSVFYPNIYKQAYQTYKALAYKEERMVSRYSDNWTKGVLEHTLKDVPYVEDKLGTEAFDQLGYPIVRRIDDVPLIPEAVLDGIQTLMNTSNSDNDKPVWDLFNKHRATIGWNGSKTFEGRDLTVEEQIDLKRMTADIIRKELEDPYTFSDMNSMTRQEFIEEIESIKSQASEDAKYKLFGNE